MGEDRGAPEPRDRDREEASTAASSAQTASSSSDEASSDEASPRDHDHEAAVSRGSSGHSDSGSGDDGSGSSSDSIDSRGVGGDGGLEEAQQTERQLEEEEVKGKGASAAQQELLEAALSELWPCKRCKASKTKCEGGFPCRRCFGHAFPCEPNDLPPALEAALQEAAHVDPRSPVATVAAALTQRRWRRLQEGAAAAGRTGSMPLLMTTDGRTAASESFIVATGPVLPETAPNPLLELVFTSSTPRGMAEMYIQGFERLYASASPPSAPVPRRAIQMLRSWRLLSLLSGGPDISWGIIDHIAGKLGLSESDLAVPPPDGAADASEQGRVAAMAAEMAARSRALQASDLFKQEQARLAEGSGLFVIGLDAEGRPAQASNLAFMRIGRPALELADDVVRHRTLSCLLFAPLISHEDRQLWLDNICALSFEPAAEGDGGGGGDRAAAFDGGALPTGAVRTQFYKAFNAEGDVVLYIITMRRVELADGGFALVHQIENMPASKHITTRPEFKKAAKRYRTLPAAATVKGSNDTITSTTTSSSTTVPAPQAPAEARADAGAGRQQQQQQQQQRQQQPQEEDASGALPLFAGMACLPPPPASDAPASIATATAAVAITSSLAQGPGLGLPPAAAATAGAGSLDQAVEQQAQWLFPPRDPPRAPPPLPKSEGGGVGGGGSGGHLVPMEVDSGAANPTRSRSSRRLQQAKAAAKEAKAAAAKTAAAAAAEQGAGGGGRGRARGRGYGQEGFGQLQPQPAVGMLPVEPMAWATAPPAMAAGEGAGVEGMDEDLELLLEVLGGEEGLDMAPWCADGPGVGVSGGMVAGGGGQQEAAAAAAMGMDQSR